MNNTQNKRNALGKGLTALLQNANTDISGKEPVPVNSIADIPLNEIQANPFQPRQDFDEGAIEELSESIRLHGVIQPITVRKIGYGKYELISGERRTRAAIKANLRTIPAYVRVANDQSMLEMALVENIHREDLNAIEVALSYRRLAEECKLNQEELAGRVGKNRTTVNNYMRLLRLPEEVQVALRDEQITMGHARCLITIESKEAQNEILQHIVDEDLNVRQTEELVKQYLSPAGKGKNGKAVPTPASGDMPEDLLNVWQHKISRSIESEVKLKLNNAGRGHIQIPVKDEADLRRIISLLEKIPS